MGGGGGRFLLLSRLPAATAGTPVAASIRSMGCSATPP